MATDPRRNVPKVDRVVDALDGLPHPLLVACARGAVDAARERAAAGDAVDEAAVVADAESRVEALRRGLLHRVVNATGVIVLFSAACRPTASWWKSSSCRIIRSTLPASFIRSF